MGEGQGMPSLPTLPGRKKGPRPVPEGIGDQPQQKGGERGKREGLAGAVRACGGLGWVGNSRSNRDTVLKEAGQIKKGKPDRLLLRREVHGLIRREKKETSLTSPTECGETFRKKKKQSKKRRLRRGKGEGKGKSK